MIRIDKPAAPAVLLTRGATRAQAHRDEYDSAPADYRSGAKRFAFNKSIYAATEVKDALLGAQHKKCAFCESLVRHITHGAVEHFRPKGGYKQRKGDRLRRPGYYWLAYDWDNLFFCCPLCNEQFKRNLFPLKDGRRRARSHTQALSDEEPLLVNPARVDPANYIGFRQERVFAVGGRLEGKTTIRVLGLKRRELREARGRRLQMLRDLVFARDLLDEKVAATPKPKLVAQLARLEAALKASQDDAAEYAAMARAFLRP